MKYQSQIKQHCAWNGLAMMYFALKRPRDINASEGEE